MAPSLQDQLSLTSLSSRRLSHSCPEMLPSSKSMNLMSNRRAGCHSLGVLTTAAAKDDLYSLAFMDA